MTAAGSRHLQGEDAEGLREHDGFSAEPDAYLAVCGGDVAEGQAADSRRPVGVEEGR